MATDEAYVQKKTAHTLFDLKEDIGQRTDLSGTKKAIVAELTKLAEVHRKYVQENRREPARH